MEFRLLYEGTLLPCGNSNTRPAEKHAIRRALHPQLRRLWGLKRGLRGLAQNEWYKRNLDAPIPHGERFEDGLRVIGQEWQRAGFNFVPLVTADLAVRCSLQITLLRPQEKRFVFTRGDLDGQLKTLFDALRLPTDSGETKGMGPQDDENPFFVLLEDDRFITEVHLIEDQMLLLPNTREVKANDAHASIHVKLNHADRPPHLGNWFGD